MLPSTKSVAHRVNSSCLTVAGDGFGGFGGCGCC